MNNDESIWPLVLMTVVIVVWLLFTIGISQGLIWHD